MPIFKLTPKDFAHPSWRGFKPLIAKIVVRAASESEARDVGLDALEWDPPWEGKGRNRRKPEYPDNHPIQDRAATNCQRIDADGSGSIIAVVKL